MPYVDKVTVDNTTYDIRDTTTAEKVSDLENDLDQYETIFTGNVDESVENWLDEHPEATTTVQDGAITNSKIANNTITKDKLSDEFTEQFIEGDYSITEFNNAANQSTSIYWRYIPSSYTPMVAYSNSVDYCEKMACEKGATAAINAARFILDGSEFYGYFRVDGITIHENDRTSGSNSSHILCYKNGILSSENISKTTSQLDALDYEWALTGFENIIVNGNPTGSATNSESLDFHPRSFIAQINNGGYIIGCSDGRSGKSNGLTLSDVYSFLISTGYSIDFAYSLDGGESVSLIEKGNRVNSYINNQHRKIKSIIYFKKTGAYYNDLLKNKVSNIQNDYLTRTNNHLYDEGDFRSYSNDATKNIEFRSLSTLLTQAFLRFQKDRIFVGMQNDFSNSGTAYNLLDVGPSYFQFAGVNRYIPRLVNSDVDYRNEIPDIAETGINSVYIENSSTAVSLGFSVEDYGLSVLITFRTNLNFKILLTRANVWYKFDTKAWKLLTPNINSIITLSPASGITGTTQAIKNNNVVVIRMDIYVSSTINANTQIASNLPIVDYAQYGLIFSSSKTCRLEVATDGTLKVMDEMPTGYYRASMTYISHSSV